MMGETRRTIAACWLVAWLGLATNALGQVRTLYYSDFEQGRDYDMEFTLIGQGGWQGEGTGGNGLVENNFEGLGQQGYIGYWPQRMTPRCTPAFGGRSRGSTPWKQRSLSRCS